MNSSEPIRDRTSTHDGSAKPISVGLRSLARERDGRVTLGELMDATGAGGTALLLFLLAVASLVPGVAPAFGAAICLLSLPLMTGAHALPLPDLLRRQSIPRARLARVLDRGLPRLERLENRLRPRLRWLTHGIMLGAAGLACLVAGLLIVLPIPFGNTAPALSVLLLALGISAADGLLVLAGFAAFALAVAFDAGMVSLSWDLIEAAAHAVL